MEQKRLGKGHKKKPSKELAESYFWIDKVFDPFKMVALTTLKKEDPTAMLTLKKKLPRVTSNPTIKRIST